MLYMLNKYYAKDHKKLIHFIFKTRTESAYLARIEDVKTAIKACNTETINFDIVNNKVVIRPWLTECTPGITDDSIFILLEKLNSYKFKLISVEEEVRYISLQPII